MTATSPTAPAGVDEVSEEGTVASDERFAMAEAGFIDEPGPPEASAETPTPPAAAGSDDMTIRDRVRLQALLLASTGYRWKIDHLLQSDDVLEESNRATIQRTLRAMTAQELLSHPRGAPFYEAGPLLEGIAEELLTNAVADE